MKYPPVDGHKVACNEQTFSQWLLFYLKERCVIMECYIEIKVSI